MQTGQSAQCEAAAPLGQASRARAASAAWQGRGEDRGYSVTPSLSGTLRDRGCKYKIRRWAGSSYFLRQF